MVDGILSGKVTAAQLQFLKAYLHLCAEHPELEPALLLTTGPYRSLNALVPIPLTDNEYDALLVRALKAGLPA